MAEQELPTPHQTKIPRRPTLVLLDSLTQQAMPEKIAALERQGVYVYRADYRNLMAEAESIRRVLNEHQIDFILFSRNDQVFDRSSIGPLIRELRVGYSAFSGIDSDHALEQTAICLDDYLAGGGTLPLVERRTVPPPARDARGSFSLIFDLEQLGGARFGLPRILKMLDLYQTTATFFATSFVQDIYHNIIEMLVLHGHEVGLHGQYHEYLAGLPLAQQIEMIERMKADFHVAMPIHAANFIFRKDAATLRALAMTGITYFVVFLEHQYAPFAYRKMPLRPMLMTTPDGPLWMVPVSAETYNRPWYIVRKMIDSAVMTGHEEGYPHINILLHPFRDGHDNHLLNLERMLHYLRHTLGYRGVPVAEPVGQLAPYEPSDFIYYDITNQDRPSSRDGFWRAWWHNTSRYQQRVANLYRALAHAGKRPALCAHLPVPGTCYAVYPHLPDDVPPQHITQIAADPLLFLQNGHSMTFDRAVTQSHEASYFAFVPQSLQNDMRVAAHISRPQRWHDYTGFLPEMALRLAYRLGPDGDIF